MPTHVIRREDNPHGAWAKSRRQRIMPLDFLTVQAFDTYELERMRVPRAAVSDFVLVNLFLEPSGAPMRPGAVGDLVAAAAARADLGGHVTPHMLRHACGSNLLDGPGAHRWRDPHGQLRHHADLAGHRPLRCPAARSAAAHRVRCATRQVRRRLPAGHPRHRQLVAEPV
jgi:site-specific recombinase XerD